MKRLGSSDSLGALMSICPSADETSPRNTHVYSREYQSMLDGLDEEGCIEESGHISEKKRRLSVDQVKALEKNFEVENKLEPERKVKLAQELGLQPRQVAVWFQNRRARWKTKQLERDYGVLKANYDNLKLNYESLQRDNETLLNEIREIKAKLNEENNLSIKEETMASDSENKAVEDSETHVAVTASDAGKDMDYTAKFNDDNGRDTVLIFPDMKDGSSDDSDSSAILNSNEENNSPNAAISSSGIVLQNNNNNHHHHHFIMSSPQPQQQPPATSSVNCFQFSDSGTVLNNTQKGYHHHQHHQQQQQQQQQQSQTQFVKLEEHNFFSGEEACNFFSDEQAPTLHWYCPDQWN